MTSRPPRRELETDDTRLDLGKHLRVVWRRRLFVLLPVLFVTSITAVGVRFMSPLYVSSARLLVEQRTRVNNELERQIVTEDKRVRRKDELADVQTQVENRDFLESVIRELGLQNDPTILARAKLIHDSRTPDVPTEEIAMRTLVRGLREKLDVRVADENTFTVEVSDNDAESAYILAKVVARSFVTEVKRERMEKLEELFKFSSQQQRIYREKVDDADRDLREFQSKMIRDQNGDGIVNVGNVAAARSQLRRLEMDEDQSQHRIDNLRDQLQGSFEPIPELRGMRQDRELSQLEKRLRADLQDEVAAELQRGANSMSEATMDATGATRSALRRRLSELADSRYSQVDGFYRDRVAEYAYEVVARDAVVSARSDLERQITRYSSRAEAQPELQLQLTSLQQRAEQARQSLDTFERTLQSAQLSETMMATELGGGVSVVDPPEKAVAPVKPDKKRLVLLAFVLSLGGGLASIFAFEYLDRSFKDVREIEQTLALQVLGTVPRVVPALPFGGIPASKRHHMIMVSAVVVLVMLLGGMGLYEHLLRKQHVTVPRNRAEEILRNPDAQPAPRLSPNTVSPAATAPGVTK